MNRASIDVFFLVTGELLYPVNINGHICTRKQVRQFAEEARAIGVQYIGLCCGNAANLVREVAEVYGKMPPASRYAADMSQNIMIGEAGQQISKEGDKVRKFSLGLLSDADIEEMRKQHVQGQ